MPDPSTTRKSRLDKQNNFIYQNDDDYEDDEDGEDGDPFTARGGDLDDDEDDYEEEEDSDGEDSDGNDRKGRSTSNSFSKFRPISGSPSSGRPSVSLNQLFFDKKVQERLKSQMMKNPRKLSLSFCLRVSSIASCQSRCK